MNTNCCYEVATWQPYYINPYAQAGRKNIIIYIIIYEIIVIYKKPLATLPGCHPQSAIDSIRISHR